MSRFEVQRWKPAMFRYARVVDERDLILPTHLAHDLWYLRDSWGAKALENMPPGTAVEDPPPHKFFIL